MQTALLLSSFVIVAIPCASPMGAPVASERSSASVSAPS